jgi:hypothetical protein
MSQAKLGPLFNGPAGPTSYYQDVVLELPTGTVIGPPTSTWSRFGAGNVAFQTTSAGYYLLTSTTEIRTNGTSPANSTRGSVAIMRSVDSGVSFSSVNGSIRSLQAPDTNHEYSISNTVLVHLNAGDVIKLMWWAGYFSGATNDTAEPALAGLSIGPNVTPWITTLFPPAENDAEIPVPVNASLVLTRITSDT